MGNIPFGFSEQEMIDFFNQQMHLSGLAQVFIEFGMTADNHNWLCYFVRVLKGQIASILYRGFAYEWHPYAMLRPKAIPYWRVTSTETRISPSSSAEASTKQLRWWKFHICNGGSPNYLNKSKDCSPLSRCALSTHLSWSCPKVWKSENLKVSRSPNVRVSGGSGGGVLTVVVFWRWCFDGGGDVDILVVVLVCILSLGYAHLKHSKLFAFGGPPFPYSSCYRLFQGNFPFSFVINAFYCPRPSGNQNFFFRRWHSTASTSRASPSSCVVLTIIRWTVWWNFHISCAFKCSLFKLALFCSWSANPWRRWYGWVRWRARSRQHCCSRLSAEGLRWWTPQLSQRRAGW